jgi:hypothetical protein
MSNEPQWSPDRQWWWNGETWIPAKDAPESARSLVSHPAQAQASPWQRLLKSPHRNLVFIVAGLGTLMLIAFIAALASNPAFQQGARVGIASPTPTTAPQLYDPNARPATAPPPPRPSAQPVALGTEILTSKDAKITVFSVGPVESNNRFLKPAAGMVYEAADVQECASPTEDRGVNPDDFDLQMPDNTRASHTIAIKDPGFHATTLGPGQCLRGWITYEIPRGQTPALILLTSSTDIMWRT